MPLRLWQVIAVKEGKRIMIRTYSELKRISSFEERYRYLKLSGRVGESTFGFDRYINQMLYNSDRWKKTRRDIIIRDNGCDLGVDGYDINDMIIVHHINPLRIEDIEEERPEVFDPEFLISSSSRTHKAIHFGDERLLPSLPIVRRRNDTCPWRQ